MTKLSFGIKNPDRIDQVIKQVEQLDIDWYRLRLDQDRKAFDSLKESSQALQGIVRTMMISLIRYRSRYPLVFNGTMDA